MKQSKLFVKTLKDIPKEAVSSNHKFLIKAGYVDQLSSGVFTLLDLGLRVIYKIENIVRKEMNNIGGIEILMPALIPKENWEETNRWNLDVILKTKSGYRDKEYGLGWTHEEVITPLVKKFVHSYKDLPKYIYQIQTKFRDEARPKSGLFRSREFIMKDLYSFHADEKDLNNYYELVKETYFKIYNILGIGGITYLTYASGGDFSKYSHEFQMITPYGEDTIYICDKCRIAINSEIIEVKPTCPECKNVKLREEKAIEVGNIFKLNNRFSIPFGVDFTDKNGSKKTSVMGCYGLGVSRVMGAVAEVYNDKNGLKWPLSVSPYDVHLLQLDEKVEKEARSLYELLVREGIEVLWDDRKETAGKKLKDADLIGISIRLIISSRTVLKKSLELKKRDEDKSIIISDNTVVSEIKKML